jgi:peptidoglycan pentaglycine glycine transferase (the first glycine)
MKGDHAGGGTPSRTPSRMAGAAAAAGVSQTAITDPRRLETDDPAWNAFVAGSPAASFLQLTAWAQVKRPNGWTATRIVAAGPTDVPGAGPVGAQVLLRRVRRLPWTLGYAARGPLSPNLDEAALGAFTAAVRTRARELGVSYVRIEPELLEDPAVAAKLRRAGWRPVARSLQPSATRLIDLSRPEQELWSDLRPKWRQYVNKARRDDVTIVAGTGKDLPAFYTLYEETASRAGVYQREEQSYRAVWDAFAPSGMARLLFARASDGRLLATLFLLACGRRMTEVYGGMSVAGADAHANYLLKWEAIRRARDEGFAEYDLWGLAHPGIAHFKAGFGGREVRYVGAWDLVIDPLGRAALEVGRRVSILAQRLLARLRPPR